MHPEKGEVQKILGAVGRAEPPAGLQQRIISACRDAEPVEAIGCDDCLELASAYLDDELHGARRGAFEAHVFACESCYFAFKQMERTADVLREVPPAAVPPDLHERITAAVERDRREREPASAFNWRRTAQVLGGLAAAAALLAAVFVPRGGDATAPTAPVVAEAPLEVGIDSVDDAASATESVETDADEAAETPEAGPAEEPVVATAPSVREPARTRASSSRSAGTRTTRPEPEPARATAPAPRPETAREEAMSAPAPPTRPEPTTPPRARSSAGETPQPERTVTEPEPAPVAAEDRPAPSPRPARVPEVTPDPPARDPQPRESVIAATPRPDPEPAPAGASVPAPQPVATSSAPKPHDGQERERLAVVPRQPHSRAVYKPQPTPPSQRSERLSRIAEGINGSQNPRMDNPSPGMILN
ncbi:MAG: zf-HC2 domain-containing protein [Armatimonadota bacterium]